MATAAPRVIKARESSGKADSAYNFIDLRQRCEAYAADIQKQCQAWVAEARAEVDRIRDEAYQEGRAAGFKDGLSDAAEQITTRAAADTRQQLNAALETLGPSIEHAAYELVEERQRWRSKWEVAACELAIALAGKLTERVIDADPTVLLTRMQAVLEMAAGHTTAVLHLNPKDIESLGSEVDAIIDRNPVEIVSDARVQPGGCVLSTDVGEIDGQLDTQLDRISEELLGSLKS